MNKTSNYQLNQWELTDRIRMEDFNADNAKIDAALKTLANQVSGKAESSTVSILAAQVNAKAEQSALAAEQTARANADSAEAAAREASINAEKAAREAAEAELAKKSGIHLIQCVTLTGEAATVDISLEGLDMSQWSTFYITAKAVLNNGDTEYYLLLNGDSKYSVFNVCVDGPSLTTLYPMFTPELPISGVCSATATRSNLFFYSLTYQELTLLRLQPGSGNLCFAAGTELKLWGAK